MRLEQPGKHTVLRLDDGLRVTASPALFGDLKHLLGPQLPGLLSPFRGHSRAEGRRLHLPIPTPCGRSGPRHAARGTTVMSDHWGAPRQPEPDQPEILSDRPTAPGRCPTPGVPVVVGGRHVPARRAAGAPRRQGQVGGRRRRRPPGGRCRCRRGLRRGCARWRRRQAARVVRAVHLGRVRVLRPRPVAGPEGRRAALPAQVPLGEGLTGQHRRHPRSTSSTRPPQDDPKLSGLEATPQTSSPGSATGSASPCCRAAAGR